MQEILIVTKTFELSVNFTLSDLFWSKYPEKIKPQSYDP